MLVRILSNVTFKVSLRIALLLSLVGAPGLAFAEPETLEGSQSLYKRVLTLRTAQVVSEPASSNVIEVPTAFTAFYVFGSEEVDGEKWLAVGPSSTDEATGWIAERTTVEWKHQMVLTFTNPAGRLRTLFFEDEEKLIDFVEDEAFPINAPRVVAQASAGNPPQEFGVVTIEPSEFIDFTDPENFYLAPILEAKTIFLANRRSTIFKMASIPLQEEDTQVEEEVDPTTFTVGVTFVIDTTSSMQDYIDRTRDTIEAIFNTIRNSPVGEQVSFGLVGFRDNVEAVPELEYTSQVLVNLDYPGDPEKFMREVSKVTAAEVSSRGWQEDGLAGMMTALELESWKDFQGRYIIYIGDSPVRWTSADPLSTTGMEPRDVNEAAREKHIAVISLLLETAIGQDYHEDAERHLRSLSFWDDQNEVPFYKIPGGDLDAFGNQIQEIADHLTADIDRVLGGNFGSSPETEDEGNPLAGIGHAMEMAWLGRVRGTNAPDVIEGWAPRFALDDPINKFAFDVRVLLSRNQLNDLYTSLSAILSLPANVIDENSEGFIRLLRSVIAQVKNDPERSQVLDSSLDLTVDAGEINDLGDALGEFIDNLPLNEGFTALTSDDWNDMLASERQDFLAEAESKMQLLKHYFGERDKWVPLHPDAPEGEHVYPIPLEALP